MNDPIYRSQWDPDGNQHRNDCGPACVCMVLDGFNQHVAINTIAAETMGASDQGTTADQLAASLRARGVNALVWTGLVTPPTPFIALVNYGGFSRDNLQDVNFRGWHWLIVLSINELTAVCHDPDYAGSRRNEGAYKRYGRAEFDAAFALYGASRIAVVWPPAGQEVQPSASPK